MSLDDREDRALGTNARVHDVPPFHPQGQLEALADATFHLLKTREEPFNAQLEGDKRCEVRHNDRGFHVGDVLVLLEKRNTRGVDEPWATGRALLRKVLHIVDEYSPEKGLLAAGTCVMSTQRWPITFHDDEEIVEWRVLILEEAAGRVHRVELAGSAPGRADLRVTVVAP